MIVAHGLAYCLFTILSSFLGGHYYETKKPRTLISRSFVRKLSLFRVLALKRSTRPYSERYWYCMMRNVERRREATECGEPDQASGYGRIRRTRPFIGEIAVMQMQTVWGQFAHVDDKYFDSGIFAKKYGAKIFCSRDLSTSS